MQMESPPRSQRRNSKRKRVKKDRKQGTSRQYAPQLHQQIDLERFMAEFRNQYFKGSLSECLAELKSEYQTSLHIKSILGED
jgi:ribosomal protein S4